jgi:hypothetical protein
MIATLMVRNESVVKTVCAETYQNAPSDNVNAAADKVIMSPILFSGFLKVTHFR